jgi:iron complex transport system substrate-binding protein
MKKNSVLIFALTLILAAAPVMLSGCGSSSSSAAPTQASGEMSSAAAESVSDVYLFTDSAGRQVEVPRDLQRILPSGSLAQTFMWPLAADRIVSTNEAYTDEQLKYMGEKYRSLPVTGNLYQTGSELNLEEVASLNAQIIIDFGEPKDTIVQDLDNLQDILGIPCIFIEGSFTNTASAYRTLGKLLNLEEEAEQTARYIEGIMNKTAEVFSRVDKRSLVFLNSSDGLGCIAKGTFFDEIWSYMGENACVVNDGQMYWFSSVNLEQLQIWDPEFIFFYSQDAYDNAMTDQAWSGLQAVQNKRCFTIPSQPIDFCFSPSVNRYMGIMWLAELMYPDAFDWDIKEEVFRYYKMFYHCDMTDELYDELMNSSHNLPY